MITFEEFTNTSDREFNNISSEEVREYQLIHQGKTITIHNPIAIQVNQMHPDEYDRHLVVDARGKVYRIPFNLSLDLLTWNTSEDSEQVVI